MHGNTIHSRYLLYTWHIDFVAEVGVEPTLLVYDTNVLPMYHYSIATQMVRMRNFAILFSSPPD
jgi:hypothetical protein